MLRIFFVLIPFIGAALLADDRLDNTLTKFERYADEARIKWKVPGVAIGIIQGDKIVFSKGFGQRGLTDTRPVDEHTIFQIGSLSKAFTSALVAKAEEKGLLKWDDKVVDHLPTFRMSDPWVTQEFEVVDLLCQRSGLPAYAGDSQSFLGYNAQEILDHLRFIKPISSFRSQYAYQNVFFLVAAEILKLKTGLNYQQLLQREIFEPLDMNNSTATLDDYLRAANSAEWLIRKPDGKVTVLNRDFPYRNWNYVLGPAGGINSNVIDMANWLILQANEGQFKGKQVIAKENMQMMHRPFIFSVEKEGISAFYALGWLHQEYSPYPIIWHNGATLGVYNVAAVIPQEKLGIVILSNVRDTQLSLALALQFFDFYFEKQGTDWSEKFLNLMLAAEKKHGEEALPKVEILPSLPLDNYTGTYRHPIYGEVIVAKKGDGLELTIGKNKSKISLSHYSHDTFTLSWPYVDETGSKVYFFTDDSSLVTKMNVQLFSLEGDGVFEKVQAKQKI